MQCQDEKHSFSWTWIQAEARDRDVTLYGNQHTFSWIQIYVSDSKESTKEKEIKESFSKLIYYLLSQTMKISKSLQPKLNMLLPIIPSLTFFFFSPLYIFLQSNHHL